MLTIDQLEFCVRSFQVIPFETQLEEGHGCVHRNQHYQDETVRNCFLEDHVVCTLLDLISCYQLLHLLSLFRSEVLVY